MSTTITSPASSSSSCNKLLEEPKIFDFRDASPKAKDVLPTPFDTSSPSELVDLALHTLHSKGIELIEWKTLLYRRMGVPVILKNYHYLVPDEDLDVASDALLELGLPLSLPPPLLLSTGGDFYAKGRLHRLTSYQSVGRAQHLVLYPRSFADFAQNELSPAPSGEAPVLVPHPSAVYASILRMMQRYSRYASTRSTLESDLSELVGYNLYGLHEGYVDVDDEEECARLEVDRRVVEAVDVVRAWGRAGAWREGEEWMGAALEGVVSGTGEIEDLPWSAS